jgi:2-amino-4-hydroxy-6-hydroxymethyldihydropteridine diphosphokinase
LDSEPVRVAIALGSNLGDRRGHLSWAAERLGTILTNLRVSSSVETDPVDVPDAQPPYLNAAVVGETTLAPKALLDALLGLECVRGRTRTSWRSARTLDLDLILYGDLVCDMPAMTLPHPRFRDRLFVLAPLAEIAADWVDPVTGKSLHALAESAREAVGETP